jgi:DNA-binding MarR family transcriptional regulator
MQLKLLNYLFESNALKILRVIHHSPCRYSLRQIAVLCDMSPSTAGGVLKQLVSRSIVEKIHKGNKTSYTLSVSEEDRKVLKFLLDAYEKNNIKASAEELSKVAFQKVAWIDETLTGLEDARSKMKHT